MGLANSKCCTLPVTKRGQKTLTAGSTTSIADLYSQSSAANITYINLRVDRGSVDVTPDIGDTITYKSSYVIYGVDQLAQGKLSPVTQFNASADAVAWIEYSFN